MCPYSCEAPVLDISSGSIQIQEKIQIPIDKDPVKTTNDNHTSLFFYGVSTSPLNPGSLILDCQSKSGGVT